MGEDFYFVDRLHGSALQGDRCTTGCEAHGNFVDDSACLTAVNMLGEEYKLKKLRTGALKTLNKSDRTEKNTNGEITGTKYQSLRRHETYTIIDSW
jgi:hypothetical protein